MADDPLIMETTGTTFADLAACLRTGAAMGATSHEIQMSPKRVLQLARIIERGQEPAKIIEVQVERSPSRWDWFFWTVIISQAVFGLVEKPATVAAAYFTGLFHG